MDTRRHQPHRGVGSLAVERHAVARVRERLRGDTTLTNQTRHHTLQFLVGLLSGRGPVATIWSDIYRRIIICSVPRPPLSESQKRLGRSLGAEIQERRGHTSASALASSSGVNLDTWRKLEQGEVPTPGFFLVANIADALEVSLDDLVTAARRRAEGG